MNYNEFNNKLIEKLDYLDSADLVLCEASIESLIYDYMTADEIDLDTIIDVLYHFIKNELNIENIKEITLNTLKLKGNEYSTNSNRFLNLLQARQLLNGADTFGIRFNMSFVLKMFVLKHVVWCLEYFRTEKPEPPEKLLEHFGDVLNYFLILSIGWEEFQQ